MHNNNNDIIVAVTWQARGFEVTGWGPTEDAAQADCDRQAGDHVDVEFFVSMTAEDFAYLQANDFAKLTAALNDLPPVCS